MAVALAIAFIVWLIVRGGGGSSGTTSTTSLPAEPARAASVDQLRALANRAGHSIYWAGAEPGHVYELTVTSSGRIFIRYLPSGAPVGTNHTYRFVGTYPVNGAFPALKKQAAKESDVTFPAPGGGFAAYATSLPTNIYLAYPGTNTQIEVFDPSPTRARDLIASGQIAPVR